MSESDTILEFIREELLEDDVDIGGDTSLFRDQLLDSMSLPRLMAFLEDTFGIKVAALDVAYENLDTANLMAAFIERKRNEDAD